MLEKGTVSVRTRITLIKPEEIPFLQRWGVADLDGLSGIGQVKAVKICERLRNFKDK